MTTSSEFTMPVLNYSLLGFKVSASNIEVVANSKQVIDDSGQSNKTRIDFPVMRAKNVNVSDGLTTRNFNDAEPAVHERDDEQPAVSRSNDRADDPEPQFHSRYANEYDERPGD